MRVIQSFCLIVILAIITGCSPNGELNNGSFHYECSPSPDLACSPSFHYIDYPSVIAVGSSFGITYSISNSDIEYEESDIQIQPASPTIASSSGMYFTSLLPGTFAFLAKTPDEKVIDFFYLNFESIEGLRIDINNQYGRSVSPEDIELTVLQYIEISVKPVDSENRVLAGGLSSEWSISAENESIIALQEMGPISDQNRHEYRVVAVGPGSDSVRIVLGEIEREIPITVVEE